MYTVVYLAAIWVWGHFIVFNLNLDSSQRAPLPKWFGGEFSASGGACCEATALITGGKCHIKFLAETRCLRTGIRNTDVPLSSPTNPVLSVFMTHSVTLIQSSHNSEEAPDIRRRCGAAAGGSPRPDGSGLPDGKGSRGELSQAPSCPSKSSLLWQGAVCHSHEFFHTFICHTGPSLLLFVVWQGR